MHRPFKQGNYEYQLFIFWSGLTRNSNSGLLSSDWGKCANHYAKTDDQPTTCIIHLKIPHRNVISMRSKSLKFGSQITHFGCLFSSAHTVECCLSPVLHSYYTLRQVDKKHKVVQLTFRSKVIWKSFSKESSSGALQDE